MHSLSRHPYFCTTSQIIDSQRAHHRSELESKKNPPVGPSKGSVAAQTIPLAPSSTGLPPDPPSSVATHPGSTELTKIPVPLSSAANFLVRAFKAAFDTLYPGVPPSFI